MAGRSLTVDMGDDDLLPAWRTVIDVSGTGIAERLTLVGGLMVATHARRAGVTMRRPTEDMDALVDYRTDQSSLIDTKTALHGIGFELSADERHAYRFRHADGRKVDIMVADQRDRARHLDDAAVLLASVTDASEFDYAGMSRNDRRRLRTVVEHVGDESHPSWANLDGSDRERGLMNATLVGRACSLG